MRVRRLAAVAAAAALVLAACGDDDDDGGAEGTEAPAGSEAPAGTGGEASGDCVVGVSWNNFQEERWAKADEPGIQAALEAGGGEYISNDAKSSAETQANNVDQLLSQGADVLIILAQDGDAIKSSLAKANEAGVPVIAYDRLIDDPSVLYMSFNNQAVGRAQAEVIFEKVPTGNYVIIKGNKADANSDFLRAGYEEVIGEAVASGDITIVGEDYTDNWDPAIAQRNMEQFLTDANNDVQAVLSENDGMATGVVAALAAQGLDGKVPVSGQDGDKAALNRVALGTQTVSVWKDGGALGTAAGEAALALCADPDIANVTVTETELGGGAVAPFESPAGNQLTSIILAPTPIVQDNLQDVIDAGWVTQEQVCQDVPAGSVPACP